MYDIKQFKRALYLVLFLGMTGFALAVEAPGLWVLSVSVLALQAWLVKTNRFRPLPRLVANIITLVALAYTFQAIRFAVTPIITIGQFLVFLQLVKLFEIRANRDYAQLLILSLLLMVAGAISTPSLAFAVILVVYLFISLYICLLFHLKIENDYALAAQTLPREKLNEATVKQDQRYLPSSMRKLAALVSLAACAMAVFIFLFFPRGAGAGMFGQLQLQPRTLTGLGSDVSLDSVTRIAQNNEIVAQVQLFKNERLVEGTQPLLLRGATADQYQRNHMWKRVSAVGPDNPLDQETMGNAPVDLGRGNGEGTGGDIYRLKVALRPTGNKMIVGLPGPLTFTPSRSIGRIHYYREDDTITTLESINQRLDYEIVARNAPLQPNILDRVLATITHTSIVDVPGRGGGGGDPSRESYISPKVAEYALRTDVSGVDAQGRPLAALRSKAMYVSELDAQIAANIEKHLRNNFNYTLDLTQENVDFDKDRVEQFLYDWRKGHCEYFASAMTLMCQSLGLQARLVTGFRCDEYDENLGHYYVVRQSHAHAWVEVKTPAGWQTFDPTSGNDIDGPGRSSAWTQVKHFFNWLEFKWAEKVVAYDGERRENLISNLDRSVVNAVVNTGMNPNRISHRMRRAWDRMTERITDWLDSGQGLMFSAKIVIGVIFLLVMVLFYGLFTIVRQRRRMRRRAARIGLGNLPPAEAMRLARQLGFYEQLMTLLEEHRIVRPPHQTPAEFGDALTFLPNQAYDTIRKLTKLFYSVRYGDRQLDHDEQKDLESTVHELGPILAHRPAIR
jgi:transglutaminase-like putative cysteine protease